MIILLQVLASPLEQVFVPCWLGWMSSLWSWTHHRARGWQRAWCGAVDVWGSLFSCATYWGWPPRGSPLHRCPLPRTGSSPAVLYLASPQSFEKGGMELQSVDPGNTKPFISPGGASSVFTAIACGWDRQGGTQESCHDVDIAGVGWGGSVADRGGHTTVFPGLRCCAHPGPLDMLPCWPGMLFLPLFFRSRT